MSTIANGAQAAAAREGDPRWAAVVARDARADGTFYYAVTTTGVYCRPSCAARLARPEHVQFYANCAEAEKAGFRPCKRCRPNQPARVEQDVSIVAQVCHFIAHAEEPPDVEALAQRAGKSRSRFHRIFKAVTGLTPHECVGTKHPRRVQKQPGTCISVPESLHDAGNTSSGHCSETTSGKGELTPSRSRASDARTDICFVIGTCSLGSLLVARSDRGVCAILLGDNPEALVHEVHHLFPQANLIEKDNEGEHLLASIVDFVEAPTAGLQVSLDIQGTAFQRRVWQVLQQIPAGKTASYAEIARQIGSPQSARVVAQACGANRLAVAIPCHRVVRTDGTLSGYRWGVERKRALLEREAHS